MAEMSLDRACEILRTRKHRNLKWFLIVENSGGATVCGEDVSGRSYYLHPDDAIAVAEKILRDAAPPAERAGEEEERTCDWRTEDSYCTREGVHVFGDGAYCDAHAKTAGETARLVALIDEAIHDASRDIGEWEQLGRRWMAESPDYARDPMCPTDAGMKRSGDVRYSLAMAMKALRSLDRTLSVSEAPLCSTHSPSTVVPPDYETWAILCAYLADEDHRHGAGISEGRLTEILAHRLGWGRQEVRAAWFDAVAKGNALIEEDHRRKAPLVQAEIERMRARAISSKGRSTEAPPSSSSGAGSAGG